MKHVHIFTDGAASPNPGPGGYGVLLVYGTNRKELSCGYRLTTNNRMELMAFLAGLEALKEPCQVELVTDSRYVADGLRLGWARRWKANGWMRKGLPVPNADLWEQLLRLVDKHQVHIQWIPGHAGHPENEHCDHLAVQAAQSRNLLIDEYYEQHKNGQK